MSDLLLLLVKSVFAWAQAYSIYVLYQKDPAKGIAMACFFILSNQYWLRSEQK